MRRGTIYKAIYTKEEIYFVCSNVSRTPEGKEDYADGIEITFHDADDMEYCLHPKKAEALNNIELYIRVMDVDMDEIWADALARKIRSIMNPKVLKGKSGKETDAGSPESNLEMRVLLLEKQKDELLAMVQNLQKSAEDFKNLELLPGDIERIKEAVEFCVNHILGGKDSPVFDDEMLRGLITEQFYEEIKREFNVISISNIKHVEMGRAMRVITEFEPPKLY